MSVVIPPGYANVKVFYINGSTGRLLSNTHGVDVTAPLTQGDVDSLSASLGSALKPVLSTGSLYEGIHVEEGQDGPPLVWDSVNTAGAGVRSVTAPATPQVQFLCDKKTALGGRQYRGRTFLGDVAEGDVNATGVVLAATVTLLQTFCTSTRTALAAGAWGGMVLLHSPPTHWTLDSETGQPRRVPTGEAAPSPTVVTSFAPDPKAATLRGRYRRI
jgi:hypothetical protein